MNSWLTIFLPKDEYKQQHLLKFFAEATVLSIVYSIVMIVVAQMVSLDTSFTLLIGLGIVLLYLMGRYVLSGMEYTEVFTSKAYSKELKKIIGQTLGFVAVYCIVYLFIISVPSTPAEWLEFGGFLILLTALYSGVHVLSLHRSYTKNLQDLD